MRPPDCPAPWSTANSLAFDIAPAKIPILFPFKDDKETPLPVEERDLRQLLADLTPQVTDFLLESIRHPSTHGNETSVQRFVQDTWESAGFDVEAHPIPETITGDPEYSRPEQECSFDGRHNLVVRIAGRTTGRTVILNSHMDVIPAEDWPDAYHPRLDDGIVYGRGACDCKGCVAAIYLVALALKALGLPSAGEIIFQMVIDEEVGGNGSLALIREGIKADGVVVVEATELAMHPANRGAVWYRFDFEGESCHMGRKHEAINALDLACETKAILYEYEEELIKDKDRQPLFAGYDFPAQVNVGLIRGGDFPAKVAGWAVMEGGIGFLPCRTLNQVKEDVVRYITELGSETLKSRYKLSFNKLHNDSFETPVDHPLVRTFHSATKETGARKDVTGWPVSCDARLFAGAGGMPTVVFGPGSIRHAHSADERIRLSEIIIAAETLVRFIERWCADEVV